jgi:hypothetical protein
MLCIPSEEAARDAIRDNFLAVANTLVKHIEILRV